MLKVSEVYEKQIKTTKERPDGSEYTTFAKVFDIRECLINENFIVLVQPHEFTTEAALLQADSAFPEGTKFSTIIVDGNSFRKSEIVVVGSFAKFCQVLGE